MEREMRQLCKGAKEDGNHLQSNELMAEIARLVGEYNNESNHVNYILTTEKLKRHFKFKT